MVDVQQIAITRFFDGDADTIDPVAEAARIPPENTRRTETLMDNIPVRSSAFPRHLEQAPRVVPTPEDQMIQPAPFLLQILFLPFNLTYTIFGRVFGTIGYLFPIIPRLLQRLYPRRASPSRNTDRRPLSPRDTAARFIREFEEEYSVESNTIPFFENGYAQAFDLAKRDVKYLLVILLSPEHDDTAPFVRETLLSTEFTSFVQANHDNTIIWAGTVQDSEAYQVANALNVTKFPFTGLVVHTPSVSSTSMSLVARIPGPVPPTELLNSLQTAMQKHTAEVEQTRSQRREQQAARSIRDEQNSAYERSLAQDRERTRQRREAEAAREKAEKEERELAEAKAQKARNVSQWRKWRAQTLAQEPSEDIKDAVRISIRMPSGDRVVRKFTAQAELEELYAFVECHAELQSSEQYEKDVEAPTGYEHEYEFQLVSPMPREVYDVKTGGTIRSRLGRSGNLIVEKLVDDDEEDENEEQES